MRTLRDEALRLIEKTSRPSPRSSAACTSPSRTSWPRCRSSSTSPPTRAARRSAASSTRRARCGPGTTSSGRELRDVAGQGTQEPHADRDHHQEAQARRSHDVQPADGRVPPGRHPDPRRAARCSTEDASNNAAASRCSSTSADALRSRVDTFVGRDGGARDDLPQLLHRDPAVGRAHRETSTPCSTSSRATSSATSTAKRAMKSALVYPTVIIVMAIGTVILLVAYVLPKFEDFFKSFDAEAAAPDPHAVEHRRGSSRTRGCFVLCGARRRVARALPVPPHRSRQAAPRSHAAEGPADRGRRAASR